MQSIRQKVSSASKWSLISEISAKLMAPITNMILARLLVPEAFGMVATITMITSFADLFTDAGFQKYIVQQNFSDDDDYDKTSCVAFWTNLSISLVLWVIILCFRDQLAKAVGNPGLGDAIAVASVTLLMTSFSSIQNARYKRELDFHTLFFVRMVAVAIPIVVTIPCAICLRSYWALIIGNICISLSNAVILTYKSSWKPKLFFSVDKLKTMISFSLWTLLEQLLGWANLNIGIFIVGSFVSAHYLGLYKTSMSSVNQIMEIAVTAFSPILLSTLSKLKNDRDEFKAFFYSFEEKIAIIILPLGVGIFIYRELFTNILLGKQWYEAAAFIGLWALIRALYIVFGRFSMEVLVALGKPKWSVFTQSLELLCLLPVLLITSQKGYMYLYIARSLVIIWSMITRMLVVNKVSNISFMGVLGRVYPYMIASVIMGICGFLMQMINNNIIWHFASVFLCIVIYFSLLMINTRTRTLVVDLARNLRFLRKK